MKKELKSKSRRKWIVTGALAFGAIALVSTGFATWVIGANKSEASKGVNVSVDTAENNSMLISVANDDVKVKIGETENVSEGVVTVKDASENNMKFTLPEITIKCGDKVKPTNLKFKLSEGEDKNIWNEGYVKLETVEASLDNVAKSEKKENGGLNVYTISNQEIKLGWGEKFKGKSPAKYYNDKYKTGSISAEEVNGIENSLTELSKNIQGKTLSITITVESEDIK